MIEEKHNQLMDELRKLRRELITAIDSPLNGEDVAHAFGVCLGSIDELLDRYSKPNNEISGGIPSADLIVSDGRDA